MPSSLRGFMLLLLAGCALGPPVAVSPPAPGPPPAGSAVVAPRGPHVVRGLPPVQRVATRREHACALTAEGEVWCWRIRTGDDSPPEPPFTDLPAPIAGIEHATDLSVPCVIADGLRCFGDDSSAHAQSPVAQGLRGVRSLSAEDSHACAVRPGGRAVCWGDNAFGQLGTPGPGAGGDVPGVQRAVEVSTGRFGACAVEQGGALVCWGAASLSSWAPGGRGWRPPAPTPPTRLRGVSDVKHVSLTGGFPCLIRATGQALCWSPEDAASLLPQNPLPAWSEVRSLTDAVALSGDLFVRASGALAALVLADQDDQPSFQVRPFETGTPEAVVGVAGSTERGCAVTRTGAVLCW